MMQQKPSKTAIAFALEKFPYGGAESVTMNIAEYLYEKGYEVFFFVHLYRTEFLPKGRKLHFKIIHIPEGGIRRSIRDMETMVREINKNAIKILFYFPMLKHIDMLLEQTDCKPVYICHGVPFWEYHIAMANYENNSRKLFQWIKWHLYHKIRETYLHTYQRRTIGRYRKCLEQVAAFVVLCDEYKEEICQKLNLSPALSRKIRAIANAQPLPPAVTDEKEKVIIYVGRLTYGDKRVDRLIDIWSNIQKQIPDWKLLIVGGGSEMGALQERARGTDNIEFAGERADVQPYYDRASILCLTSQSESWGLCLTEAQANGVVPIAFDCSAGIRHILSPSGTNGFIIPEGDSEAYISTIIRLTTDEKLLHEMSMSVRKKSREYSLENIGQKWIDLIESLR